MLDSVKTSLVFPMSLVFLEIGTYLANDMYLPGLPTIAKDLMISQDSAQMTLLVWFLGSASIQLLSGPFSDRYGRRTLLVSGAFLFFVSSLVCAITTNFTIMMIARFIQGACIGLVVVPGYAAIHELYQTTTAIKIISIMGSVTILAPAFGPLLGALLIEVSHWRIIFWLLTIWGLVATLILYKTMPNSNPIRVPLHVREILRDYISISIRPAFLSNILPFCLLFLGFICWIVESPFIIIETLGRSRVEFGIIQLLIFGCFIVGAQITRVVIERLGSHVTIMLGLATASIGVIIMLGIIFLTTEHLYSIVVLMMVIALGASITFGPLNRSAIDACEEPMGRRTAISSTFMGVFGVLGVWLATVFNDKTIDNISFLVAGGTLLATLVYIVFHVTRSK